MKRITLLLATLSAAILCMTTLSAGTAAAAIIPGPPAGAPVDGELIDSTTTMPVDASGVADGPSETQTVILSLPAGSVAATFPASAGLMLPASSGTLGNGGNPTGCHNATTYVRQYTTLGALHWQWNQKVHWCTNGVGITSLPSVNDTISNAEGNVNYLGLASTPDDHYFPYFAGHPFSGYAVDHQGHIQYCLAGSIGCYDNRYPEIIDNMRGDGTLYWHTDANTTS
jgi:hypothetical protein